MTTSPTFRVAVYYAPEPDDPLWAAGNRWLGRDPDTGATLQRPDAIDIPNLTDEPAGYGLHATLKPPMRLAPGTALLFDNGRTLHGRRAYQGFRRLCGAYLNREDFDSKLRVLRAQVRGIDAGGPAGV